MFLSAYLLTFADLISIERHLSFSVNENLLFYMFISRKICFVCKNTYCIIYVYMYITYYNSSHKYIDLNCLEWSTDCIFT